MDIVVIGYDSVAIVIPDERQLQSIKFATTVLEEEFRSQDSGVRMQSVRDSDPPLIEDHQIYNFGAVFHGLFIHYSHRIPTEY